MKVKVLCVKCKKYFIVRLHRLKGLNDYTCKKCRGVKNGRNIKKDKRT